MQTEILQIKKEDALKAYKEGTPGDKKLLENLFGSQLPTKITDRVKSFYDVLRILKMDHSAFNLLCNDLLEDEKAYRGLKLVAEVLNEGWKPNWDDPKELKWVPYFNMTGSGLVFCCADCWGSHSDVGSRLCFRSRELAEYAGRQFIDLYRAFMIF